MISVVLDTSALVRLYIPDGPLPADLEGHIEDASRGNTVILAPELILAEAAQVLHKKVQQGVISAEEAAEILDEILRLPLELISHRHLIEGAMGLASESGLTVYDALFCVLARKRRAELVTCDECLDRVFRREATTE